MMLFIVPLVVECPLVVSRFMSSVEVGQRVALEESRHT